MTFSNQMNNQPNKQPNKRPTTRSNTQAKNCGESSKGKKVEIKWDASSN